MTPLDLLRTNFGYHSFRGEQESIINHILAGGNALVLMPTGGGKSLCYQIPAMIQPGLGIVISPLIALMQDQVSALLQLGVRAAFLNSTLTPDEAREVIIRARQGQLDLLYVSPEKLVTTWFLDFLSALPLALFAIDEAHCVSRWGHDFRPEYTQLAVLAQRFPQVPRIALTATADEPTRRDIITHLELHEARIFIASFDRPNIRYTVVSKDNARRQLLNFLTTEHRGDAGIIYCLSRKKVEETATWLQTQGWNALPYHAELPSSLRKYHQERFLREEGVIIVATIAFGLGIDKPNVRFVAHLDLPKSVEAYYQETGRSGRDGLPANAWMTYGLQDVVMLRKMMDTSPADEQHKRLERHKLEAMLNYCEIATCRRQTLLAHFGEQLAQPCGNCDICLEPVETWDGTEVAQKALSCVYRTRIYDQRQQTYYQFGVNYLIEVLLGKEDDRIKRNQHHLLSTFGIGKELKVEQWYSVFRQLIAAGLVTVDLAGHGGLQLTEQARPVLRGEQKVHFRKDVKLGKQKQEKKYLRKSTLTFEGTDQILWEALRTKRLELANAQNVPPYIIFHDSTLAEIVQYQPSTLEELANLSGVGTQKLKQYGQAFLALVEAHRMNYGNQTISTTKKPLSVNNPVVLPETVETTLTAFNQGQSPLQIAEQRQLVVGTIYNHLSQAIEWGQLKLHQVISLPAEEISELEEVILNQPAEQGRSLKPVFEQLNGKYSYDILRCIQAHLWREVNP